MKSISSSIRLLASSVLLAGAGLAIVGCQDALTWGDESRAEGIQEYNQGQYDVAAGSFHNAVKQNPRDYQSYYWMGVTYDASKDYQEAIAAYRTSLQVQAIAIPGRNDLEFRHKTIDALAIAIAKSPSRSQEIDQIEQKTTGRPTVEDSMLLAKIYRYSGDADGAIENYNRAVLLDPSDLYASREAGLYFQQVGKSQNAEPLLKRVYNANPSDAVVANALRQIGIVPGPSLKDQSQLEKPIVPVGPIPSMGFGAPSSTDSPPQVQTPRD